MIVLYSIPPSSAGGPTLWLAARADFAEADPRDWRPIEGVSAYRTLGELAARVAEVNRPPITDASLEPPVLAADWQRGMDRMRREVMSRPEVLS